MKRILLAAAVLVASLSVQAYEKRDFLQKSATEAQVRGCLVMNQKWVPYPAYADREGWNKFLGEYRDRIISDGEKMLGYKWEVVKASQYLEFEKSGSRKIMEDPNNRNSTALGRLLMAELAEGKGRFITDIMDGVFYFCEQTTWAESAHLVAFQKSGRSIPDYRTDVLELHQGGLAQMLSWTYYYLHDQFDKIDPVISLRLRHELQKRELDPYINRTDFWWMASDESKPNLFVNNWNPWCNANALLCYMLLENDRDRLARAVYKSMTSVDRFLNYVKADGACEEGATYWQHACGKLFDYISELYLITGGKVSLYGNRQVRSMGEYVARSYIADDWVVNFADASARTDNNTLLTYRYGKAVGSDMMVRLAADRYRKHPVQAPNVWLDTYKELETMRMLPLIAKEQGGYRPATFTWYPETEVCFMRNGGTFFAAKGGYNDESHNHNDIGTFVLYFDNTPVMIDAGVGTYTRQTFSSERYSIWTMQSLYHNVPVINGEAQKYGRQYKARGAKADSRTSTFTVDIAGAYPKEAGVDSWTRSYRLKKDRLVIADAYRLDNAKGDNVVNFMTWGDIDQSQSGVIGITVKGVKAQLRYDAKAFEPAVEAIRLDDPRLSKVWGPQIYRVSLKAKNRQASGNYQFEVVKK